MSQRRPPTPEIEVSPDPVTLADDAARHFAELAAASITDHDSFNVALSGGSTPRSLYQRLTKTPYDTSIEWSRVRAFFSDERFVPLDSEESNFRLANENLLSLVPIPESSVYPVATEEFSPEEAAVKYEERVSGTVPPGLGGRPRFDLILLGLGPDGHTASLFPGSAALTEQSRLVVANYVSKFDSWRITFTYPLINAANCVMFLAQGAEKADKVRQELAGDTSLPATGVCPTDGRLIWMLDAAAAQGSGSELS